MVVGRDEGLDMGDELFNCGEACSAQGLGAEHRKPNFDLVEPRGMSRGKVEVQPRMLAPKSRVADAMGAEIIEDDVEFLVRVVRDQPLHELEKLGAPLPFEMAADDLSGGDVEGRKEGARAMAFILRARNR